VTDDELGDTGDFDDFEEFESEFDGSDLDHLDDDFEEFESEFADQDEQDDEDDEDEPDDEDDAADVHPAGTADPADELPPAIRARNWKTILIVDALGGLGAFVVGLVLMAAWNLYAGAFMASAALVYLLLVGRRALQWRWLRRQAGL
jgi:hypothetical protein